MSPAAWLAATARAYHRSAGRLERMGAEADCGGLSGEQWAIVYRAIASELYRCAAAADVEPATPVSLDPALTAAADVRAITTRYEDGSSDA